MELIGLLYIYLFYYCI